MKNYQKALFFTVIALVLINLTLIIFIWQGHQMNQRNPKGLHEERMHRQLSAFGKRLELKENQKESFRSTFREHNSAMNTLDEREQQLRRSIHRAAFESNHTQLDSLTLVADALANQRTRNFISFSKDLAQIVEPQQREKMLDIMSRMPGPPTQKRSRIRGRN